jgi:hypothetical protein
MKFGIKTGLTFIIIGAVFVVVNYFTMQSKRYFPALLVAGPLFIGLGVGFLLFKGVEPGPEVPDKDKVKYYWKGAPVTSKIMWLLFAGLGGAAGVYLMISIDGRF